MRQDSPRGTGVRTARPIGSWECRRLQEIRTPLNSDMGAPFCDMSELFLRKMASLPAVASAVRTPDSLPERRPAARLEASGSLPTESPRLDEVMKRRSVHGTGKAGIVEEGQKFSLGQRVMHLKPDRAMILPEYLLFHWLSPLIQQDQIADRMKGSASPHLNIGALRKFSIYLPPLQEQLAIVKRLQQFQQNIESIQQIHKHTGLELDALLPSILDGAFRGEL